LNSFNDSFLLPDIPLGLFITIADIKTDLAV